MLLARLLLAEGGNTQRLLSTRQCWLLRLLLLMLLLDRLAACTLLCYWLAPIRT